MMFFKRTILLLAALALAGCEAALERPGVPIVWLVPLGESCPAVPAEVASTLLPELQLEFDSAGHWRLAPEALATLRRCAPVDRVALSHAAPLTPLNEAGRRGLLMAYAEAARALEADSTLRLNELWLTAPDAPQLWPWADAAPRLPIRLALADSCLPGARLLLPVGRDAGGDHKVRARREHPALGQRALACGTSAVLGPLYLGGPDRLVQLKNALRFWPDSLRLEALVIATTEPVPAWADSLSPFGLARTDADTRALRQWLNDYARAR